MPTLSSPSAFRRAALVLACVLIGYVSSVVIERPVLAQLSYTPPSFAPKQTIPSATFNSLFATIDQEALNRTGGVVTGNITFSPDNTVDLGASGATRARDLFLGRNAVIGGTLGVTGASTFASTIGVTGVLTGTVANFSAAVPVMRLIESDAAANSQRWRMLANSSIFTFDVANDAESATGNIFTATRSGTTIAEIAFQAPVLVSSTLSVTGTSTLAALSATTMTVSGATLLTKSRNITTTDGDQTIALNSDDYLLRVTTGGTATDDNISGFSGGTAGGQLVVCNLTPLAAPNGLLLYTFDDTAATASARITRLDGAAAETNAALGNNCQRFHYDGASSRWRTLGGV